MSGVYESFKVRVQDTLQRGKTPPLRVKNGSALTLQREMEELERIVVARLGKIKTAVNEGETEVEKEAEQANQFVESLQVRITALEAKLTETEETLRRKDLASQQMEESLRANNQQLQNDITKKDETLATRGKKINDLELQIDDNLKQIAELKSGMEKAKEAAANQLQRTAILAKSSQATVAALEAQLNEIQDLARQKDAIIEGTEQKLAVKIKEFEVVLKDKEKLLVWQEAEVADLKAQLQVLKKGVGEMSSFFRQAEALSSIKKQDVGSAVVNERANGKKERPLQVELDETKLGPVAPADAGEVVTPDLFQRIAGELADVSGVITSLALVIVRQQVEALGESMGQFPKARLSELLDKLAHEIPDEKQQIDFRGRLERNAQASLN